MQLGQEKKSGMSDSLTPVHGKSHHALQASHCIQVDPSSSSFPYTNPHIGHSPSLSVSLVLLERDSFCRCFLRISTPLEVLVLFYVLISLSLLKPCLFFSFFLFQAYAVLSPSLWQFSPPPLLLSLIELPHQ